MDPVLAALITEGEAIQADADAALSKQGSSNLHIDQVTDWLDRSAAYVAANVPSLAGQALTARGTEPFQTISAAVFRNLNLLNSIARTKPGAAVPVNPRALAAEGKPGSLSDILLAMFLPKRNPWRRLVACFYGLLVLVAFLWAALPEKTKEDLFNRTAILPPAAQTAPAHEPPR